jgi:3-oxosteroid 1-dehydrogenase
MTDGAEFDLIVVGSGGGGLCAALVAQAAGKRVVVIEKRPKVGGSTSMSGGILWLPDNPLAERAGFKDSLDAGMSYFEAVVGDAGPASSLQRRERFIREGRKMIGFLERVGMKFVVCADYPDYYDERPGGGLYGRALAAEMLGSRRLGDYAAKLQQFEEWTFPVNTQEFHNLALVKRSWPGRFMALKLAWRIAVESLTRQRLLCRGAALQGRMLEIILARKIPIWCDSPVEDLILEEGHVQGVRVRSGAGLKDCRAPAVLLNGGGFGRSQEMRSRYHPQPSSATWSAANLGDTGELIECVIRAGGATAMLDEAIWIPVSILPSGGIAGFHNPNDLAKPFSIVVGANGKRFADEAGSYMEFGQKMYAAGAVPAWAILESRNRKYYPWGSSPPGSTPQTWLDSGYMKKADSIPDLARQCGIDPSALSDTVSTFNAGATQGVDPEFNRGARIYDRYYADPTHKPNATLGPIEQAPFYAVQLVPGDVGTFGGLMTDADAAVVKSDGTRIEGLYATGNCTASVMGRTYPGAGASIAASYVFGFVAAKHALGIEQV